MSVTLNGERVGSLRARRPADDARRSVQTRPRGQRSACSDFAKKRRAILIGGYLALVCYALVPAAGAGLLRLGERRRAARSTFQLHAFDAHWLPALAGL
jgi:hypothetical protein